MDSQASWTARFEQTFTAPASAVRARIWQQVYGPEYPSRADPFSYVSVTELRRFAEELRTARGQCLVDVGCGRGGPGLWVAAATGARLIGIDLGYQETLAWRDRQQRTGQALLAAAAELAAESGGTAGQLRARISEMNATLASISRRVLVIAQRRPATSSRQPGQHTRAVS